MFRFRKKRLETPYTFAITIGNDINERLPDDDAAQLEVIAHLARLWSRYDLAGQELPSNQAAQRIAQLFSKINPP